MTEAGIDGGWNRDLFVAMGEDLGDGAWSLRLQYKPMVRFIWLGALVMAIGGFIADVRPALPAARRGEAAERGSDAGTLTGGSIAPCGKFLVPIGLFAALAAFLFVGLGRDRQTLPSPLIGKPAPLFELPSVEDPRMKVVQSRVRGPAVCGERLGHAGAWLPRGARSAAADRATRRGADHRAELEGRDAARRSVAAHARQSVRASGLRPRRARRRSTGACTARRRRSWSGRTASCSTSTSRR